jgi:DNA polymerase-3 subunit delta
VVVTLAGENDVERQRALRDYVDTFVAEHTDMGLERLDGEEASYERMVEAVQGLPFLASKKLVVLRAPGKNKDFTEQFEAFIEAIAETNDVLIVEPKLDKRLTYYKQLKKLTEFRDFAVLDAHNLVRYVGEYTRSQGGNISQADARHLVERVGVHQLQVQHELDKLINYSQNITRASIDLLTDHAPQSKIFELLDAAFAGNMVRTTQLYKEQRAQQVEPQQIIAMLAWQLHILALAKTAGNRTSDEAARAAKVSPFSMQKSLQLARRLSYEKLVSLVRELRELDAQTKSGASAEEAVQFYLLQLSQ